MTESLYNAMQEDSGGEPDEPENIEGRPTLNDDGSLGWEDSPTVVQTDGDVATGNTVTSFSDGSSAVDVHGVGGVYLAPDDPADPGRASATVTFHEGGATETKTDDSYEFRNDGQHDPMYTGDEEVTDE